MKISKKKLIVLIVFLVLLLSQIPFAYRRYKLRRLNAAIARVNAERAIPQPDERFTEYQGVAHVHSFLGGHSAGTFSEIIEAAKANGLQFVIMTEHTERDFDTSAMTLSGVHAGVLFVNGNEVSTANGDRLLVLPGEASLAMSPPTQDVTRAAGERGSVALVAYPEEFKSWDVSGLQGVEVFNVYTNARRINPVVAFFDALWSRRSYPDLLFALYYQRPNESLKHWDQALTRSRSTAIAGNDAHANIGVSLRDSSGKTLAGIQLDPYETSFRLVRMHVLIEKSKPLDQASLLEAIKAGHCFIGFDFLGDTSSFSFTAESDGETRIQGDEITLGPNTKLRIRIPVSGRVLLFRNGGQILDESGVTMKEISVTERGVYRVEIYLPQISEQPWIISNPIYVR
ncbi:MAG TPA: hypothetical protein VJT15_01545 [Pyrinomonadaceae bacterium]|nr:hypothetical protein [Pyrinomonadaceae bacterium]